MSKADKKLKNLHYILDVSGPRFFYMRYSNGQVSNRIQIDTFNKEVTVFDTDGEIIPLDLESIQAFNLKMQELGWEVYEEKAAAPIRKEDKEFGKDLPEEFADEVWYSFHCGNEDCTESAPLVPWDKYCSECGMKIDWSKYNISKGEL